MRVVFLSDVHLRREKDHRYQRLLLFFDQIIGRVDHLYIVGDFFDFWFCSSRNIYPEYILVINKLLDLKKSGTKIHWCEGNHDFYLKSYFTDKLGMDVFTDWADIHLDGKKVLIGHGDVVDRENTGYLALRWILRSKIFYLFQWLIPPFMRWKLARLSSDVSKEFPELSKEQLVAKMEAFSVQKIQDGYDAIILGHCHKPLLKYIQIQNRKGIFASLGDWIEHESYLSYENGEFRLEFFKP